MKSALAVGAVLSLFPFGAAFGAETEKNRETSESTLSLDQFLGQVRNQNQGMKGAVTGSEGSQLRSKEGELLLAPTLYGNAQITRDSKLTPPLFLIYDNALTETFSLGVSQLTTFGLQAKLHYDIYSITYNGAQIAPSLSSLAGNSEVIAISYANASPVLELTQNLWSNGFGASTRANQEYLEAQALAASYNSGYQAQSVASEAETNYWGLALARQQVTLQNEAVDRAKKIYDYNVKQARLQLRDESDVVQAEALLRNYELSLLTAQANERTAARAFNSSRNLDSDQVPEKLAELSPELLDTIQTPTRARMKLDVLAAEQSARASRANAIVNLERDKPTLDLFASATLNGQTASSYATSVGSSIGPSFTLNRPTYVAGIRFSAPLDVSLVDRSKNGWKQESVAAEFNYDRKTFEQEQKWRDLNESLTDARKQLELSRKLVKVEKSKLEIAKKRLSQGRMTTYQVLLFEQDYLSAELGRLNNQKAVLNLIAQMKLFGGPV